MTKRKGNLKFLFLNYPYNCEKVILKMVLMKVKSQQIHNFYNGSILNL